MKRSFAIFGPPGTGKSHEILARVKDRLASGIEPKDICLLSFTRAAAQELADRAGLKGAQISTIHALAFRVLEITRKEVVGVEDLREISRISGCKMTLKSIDSCTDLGEGDFYVAGYNLARSLCMNPKDWWDNTLSDPRCNKARYVRFISIYDKYKTANGLLDFGDMLEKAAGHCSPAFKCVFIDEAQDLSPAQWKLIESWLPLWDELHVAGDDDQAIYKWGGADPHGMASFVERHGAEVATLKQSHRIPRSVYSLANRVVHAIKHRYVKEYLPREEEGMVERMKLDQAVASMEHGMDILFLYRNHSMRYDVCKFLNARKIPYVIDGGVAPLTSPLGKAVAIWNRVIRADERALSPAQLAIIKKVANSALLQAIGDKHIPSHKRWQDVFTFDKDITPYLVGVERIHGQWTGTPPTIHLSTIHGSKGREANTVFLLDAVSKRTYESMLKDMDSELRTFYVAITRAKKRLVICKGFDFKNRQTGLF